MASVNNQVVFITGGAAGVGAEVARRLHRQGAKLVLTDVDAAAQQFMGEGETLFIHAMEGAGPSTYAICFGLARLSGPQNAPVALTALAEKLPGLDRATLLGPAQRRAIDGVGDPADLLEPDAGIH